MHLIEYFVRNPVKVAVGVLLVLLYGLVAVLTMPMQLTPEVETPTITVSTFWRGASPQEIEREIVLPQEEQLKGVENARKLRSECRDSEGRVSIEFAVGTNIEAALVRVNRRLQQVREYPEDADEPVIYTSGNSGHSIAWFILSPRPPDDAKIEEFSQKFPQHADALQRIKHSHSAGLAILRLRELVAEHPELHELTPPEIEVSKLRKFARDVIEARFERVKGVADSNVFGGREEEIQVFVDPERLSARRITIADLRDALRRQNQDTSGGDFWEGKRRYVVRTLGQFRTIEQVADQIVTIQDGAPVYVRDVAEVRQGHKKPDGLVKRYGDYAIGVNAEREAGANVLEVMRGLVAAASELNAGVLKEKGLALTHVYDETEYIYSAIGLVGQNIVVGGLLTVFVLLMFLRSGRSTLVIGLAIPTSIVGTFLLLSMLDRSLNVVSLAGLAFAVGMLVDNAVVVLENIYRHYQRGERAFAAAVTGTREVWGAVVASTLTTLVVFVPILFVKQEAGQLFRDIALAISFAVGLSLIVSVTVIPTACSRLLQHRPKQPLTVRHETQPTGWLTAVDALGRGFVDLVLWLNRWIQQSIPRSILVSVLLVALSIGLSWWLWPEVEYLPAGNRNLVFGSLDVPPGYNTEQLMEMGDRVERHLRPYWDVDLETDDLDQLEFPAIRDYFFVTRGRSVFLGLRAEDPTRVRELIPLVQQLNNQMPGTKVVANQASLFGHGFGGGRVVELEISGPRLDVLYELGDDVVSRVATAIAGSQTSSDPSLVPGKPEIHVVPRSMQTAQMRVDNSQLGYLVDALVDGAYATDFFVDGDKIDLSIIGKPRDAQGWDDFRGLTQDLDALPLATPEGHLVTLTDLAEVKLSSGPEEISRRERERAITITVTPPVTMSLEATIAALRNDVIVPLRDDGKIPVGYQMTLSGTADKLRETWQALRWNLLLALIITYLLMAALFESWLYPFVIILSVPLGAVGGVVALRLLSVYVQWRGEPPQTLDVLTMLGFVILIGTVVNNAILIVHQSLNHLRNDDMTVHDAIMHSVESRIRPIFMTTTTTIFGLMPLVFYPGAGSELYRGLGAVVLGGLFVSTLFTLVLVPTLFNMLMQFNSRSKTRAVIRSLPRVESQAG